MTMALPRFCWLPLSLSVLVLPACTRQGEAGPNQMAGQPENAGLAATASNAAAVENGAIVENGVVVEHGSLPQPSTAASTTPSSAAGSPVSAENVYGAVVAANATGNQVQKDGYAGAIACLVSFTVLAGMENKTQDSQTLGIANELEAKVNTSGAAIGLTDAQIRSDFSAVGAALGRQVAAIADADALHVFQAQLATRSLACVTQN